MKKTLIVVINFIKKMKIHSIRKMSAEHRNFSIFSIGLTMNLYLKIILILVMYPSTLDA